MKKSKIAALALAGTLTVTALLAGTYAWQNLNQIATNEVLDEANPGGRLHDDFNGTNKDVYVENFTSEEDGGVSIYARIKLTEYLETGSGAGLVGEGVTNNATPLIEGTSITDKTKWTVFDLYNDNEFRDYVEWTMGGKTDSSKYMPTFNKNKDSIESDINGTLTGLDGNKYDTADAYSDYVDYSVTANQTKISLEVHDADTDADTASSVDDKAQFAQILAAVGEDSDIDVDNNDDGDGILDTLKSTVSEGAKINDTDIDGDGVVDEITVISVVEMNYETADGGTATRTVAELDIDGDGVADVRVEENQTHVAADMSYEATVITMAEWKSKYKSQAGPYWVFDTDGWAYWAQEIKPGETTGCLLNGIEILPGMTSEYYYAIDVTAQFASAGDWGTKADADKQVEASGFYANGGMSDDALYLLNVIAAGDKKIVITTEGYNAETGVTPDTPVTFNASVKLGTMEVDDKVKWSLEEAVSENTKIDETTGVLTVGEDETAEYLFVTASLEDNEKISKTYMVTVGSWYEVTIVSASETDYVVPENIEEITLEAIVTDQRNSTVDSAIAWSLLDGSDNTVTLTEQTDGTAVLKITKETELDSIAVQASSDVNKIATDDIEVFTQIEYVAMQELEPIETATSRPVVTIDGINWYILYKQQEDLVNNLSAKALLWSESGIYGWGGDSSKTYGWRYYNPDAPFANKETNKEAGSANWWKYSNLRTWLNSAGEDEFVTTDAEGGTTATVYNGFLADKNILRYNSLVTTIYTKKEYSSDVNDPVSYVDTEDKFFILTQADLYGHAGGVDEDGNSVGESEAIAKDYTVRTTDAEGNEIGVRLVNEAMAEEMRKSRGGSYYLRSPRNYPDDIAYVNIEDRLINGPYKYSGGSIARVAFWLDLSGNTN